ncbi:ferritin-like domain-containing protein [Halobellus ordinarius]|uniref:ferritin-like domain-containing protein n=1 Tax=Halobellus ordinarius TaxID=3075120 RepID=UPI002880438F|nr:ferritin-like domain-containing protein [Halobellus sp. ZY16]
MTEPTDTESRAAQIAESVKDHLDSDEHSRRSFLGRSAVAGGTLLALGGATGSVLAQDDEAEEEPEEPEEAEELTASFDDVEGTDIDVLNYALTLEHLESAFYREGLETFDEEDFAELDLSESDQAESAEQIYGYLQEIGEQEATHVDVLTQAVELLGGTPNEEQSYDFGYETVEEFLQTARVLENIGVSAYAGAAPFVESPDLLSSALAIHSVEARHAAFLNELTGESPFPNAFDPAESQENVLEAAGGFIVTEDGEEGEETGTETEEGNTTTTDDGTGTTTDGGNITTTDGGNTTTTDGSNATAAGSNGSV